LLWAEKAERKGDRRGAAVCLRPAGMMSIWDVLCPRLFGMGKGLL
jgi:hypothetical protein